MKAVHPAPITAMLKEENFLILGDLVGGISVRNISQGYAMQG
jgi:hypothetical protein